MSDKKILLYLGKFPGYGFDVDGGSILARQLIDTLKEVCALDVVFIRKNDETFSDAFVRSVRYVPYLCANENKFARRLKNLSTNRAALSSYKMYDRVITAHVSKFFGMKDFGAEFWERTILFPMFCTNSYKRVGEVVPAEYTNLEREVINFVQQIITPSTAERDDLIRDYDCDAEKIFVVNRGIPPLIKYKFREHINRPLRLICIGSLKRQKNTPAALKLLIMLEKLGLSAELHLVCTIQEQSIYRELCEFISLNELASRVKFHIAIPQTKLAELLTDMDMNISVSLWETFGRGIFEGACAGLPTLALDSLSAVKNLCANNSGIIFCESVEAMATEIFTLTRESHRYRMMSAALAQLAKNFSYEAERQNLLEVIFS